MKYGHFDDQKREYVIERVDLPVSWTNYLGGGESALVSFLHYWALGHFISLAEYLGRDGDVRIYTAMREKVHKVCNEKLWDQEWFIRGVTKNGKKIGTAQDQEGKIHLESNAWAVLSGAADPEKGAHGDGQCVQISVYALRYYAECALIHGAR